MYAGFDYSNLLNFWLILTFEEVGMALADGSCRVDWQPAPGLLMPLRIPCALFIEFVSWLFDLTLDWQA